MVEINNDLIKIGINDLGAELEYLQIKDVNILWSRNDLWIRQSPILFPFCCRVKDGYYTYNGKKYQMNMHGFAKDSKFVIDEISKTSVKYLLKDNLESMKCYPFKFNFYVEYKIIDNKLEISFIVENKDEKEMYFSVGFHPGFSYQSLMKLLGDDIIVKYNSDKAISYPFESPYVTTNSQVKLNDTPLKDIFNTLIKAGTICYDGPKKVVLEGKDSLSFSFDTKYIALWGAKPENPTLICVEPWEGLPDREDTDHSIENKYAVQSLKPHESFKRTVTIQYN